MADLRSILETHYFSVRIDTTLSLGNRLNRNEIEQVLTDAGYSLPFENSVEFFIVDADDNRFRVTYAKDTDEYSFIKYKHAN